MRAESPTLWVGGNGSIGAVGRDSAGRIDTDTLLTYLPVAVTFAYDLNGNMRTNGTRILDYDDENQLIRVTEPASWKSEFLYDGKLRRRVRVKFAWTAGAWCYQPSRGQRITFTVAYKQREYTGTNKPVQCRSQLEFLLAFGHRAPRD